MSLWSDFLTWLRPPAIKQALVTPKPETYNTLAPNLSPLPNNPYKDLHPALQALAPKFLDNCRSAGLSARITVTWRNPADQDAAFAKGLSNAKAGQSPHNCCKADGSPNSKAFDFALFDNGVYIPNGQDQRYQQAGHIAESLGLAWGGRWHHPDYDHVELPDWRQA